MAVGESLTTSIPGDAQRVPCPMSIMVTLSSFILSCPCHLSTLKHLNEEFILLLLVSVNPHSTPCLTLVSIAVVRHYDKM